MPSYGDSPNKYFKPTDRWNKNLDYKDIDRNTYDNVLNARERSKYNAWAMSNENHPFHESMSHFAAASSAAAIDRGDRGDFHPYGNYNPYRNNTGVADAFSGVGHSSNLKGGGGGSAGTTVTLDIKENAVKALGDAAAVVQGVNKLGSLGSPVGHNLGGSSKSVSQPAANHAKSLGVEGKLAMPTGAALTVASAYRYVDFDQNRRAGARSVTEQLRNSHLYPHPSTPVGLRDLAQTQHLLEREHARLGGRAEADKTVAASSIGNKIRQVAVNRSFGSADSVTTLNHMIGSTPHASYVGTPLQNVFGGPRRSAPPTHPGILSPVTQYGSTGGIVLTGVPKDTSPGRYRSGFGALPDNEWDARLAYANRNQPQRTGTKIYTAGGPFHSGAQNLGSPTWWNTFASKVEAGFIAAHKKISSGTAGIGRAANVVSGSFVGSALNRVLGGRPPISGPPVQASLFGGAGPLSVGGGGGGNNPPNNPPNNRRGFFRSGLGQIRHAAVWSAYAPVFGAVGTAGAGMLGALPAQQDEAQAAFHLAGVGYDRSMTDSALFRSRMAAGAGAFLKPSDYLKGMYEVSSGFATNPGNFHDVAGIVDSMARYRIFSHENMGKGTQQVMRLAKQFQLSPKFRGMSDRDRLDTIALGSGRIIETSLMKGQDISTYMGYAGPTLMRMNWTPGMSLAMGGQLFDTGLSASQSGVAMRKFDTSMRASLTKMQIATEVEQERIAQGKTGSATYFPWHRMKSPWSAEKGNAMVTLGGVPLYKVFRQRMMQNAAAWQSGDPNTVASQLQELSAQAQYWIGERGVPMSRLGIPEQSWPAIQAMGTPGFMEQWRKRATQVDDTKGNKKRAERADKEANAPTTVPLAFDRAKRVIPGWLSGVAEDLGATGVMNSISDHAIKGTAGRRFRDLLNKGDFSTLLREKESALDTYKANPDLQRGLAETYTSEVRGFLLDPKRLGNIRDTATGKEALDFLSRQVGTPTTLREDPNKSLGVLGRVKQAVNLVRDGYNATYHMTSLEGDPVYDEYMNRKNVSEENERRRLFSLRNPRFTTAGYSLASKLDNARVKGYYNYAPDPTGELGGLVDKKEYSFGFTPSLYTSKLHQRNTLRSSQIDLRQYDDDSPTSPEEMMQTPEFLSGAYRRHQSLFPAGNVPFNSLSFMGGDQGTGVSGKPIVVNVYVNGVKQASETSNNTSGATAVSGESPVGK